MEQKKIAAGTFVLCPKTGRHLMMKRPEGYKYAGYWSFPGGGFEDKDGSPKVAAIREFREETGYEGEIIISKSPILVEKSNHLDFYSYLCIVQEEFVPNLKGEEVCGTEHVEYAWFELSVIFDKIMPSAKSILENKMNVLKEAIKKFNNG